jgi:hypothetical protein
MATHLKAVFLVVPLVLAGCVSIELPHVVADTANVSKEAYQALTGGKRDAKKREQDANAISHSYIGNNSQTTTEVKQRCETEAAQKLRQMGNGSEVRYTLLENEIVAINGTIAANCRIALAK